jgi:outer membrane protein, adhesin transport system
LKKKLSLSLAAAIFSSVIHAETLQECIGEILETNPVVIERLKHYKWTREDINIARSGYLPKIDIVVGKGKERSKTLANNYTSESMDVYESSLIYTQNIFNGFQTYHQLKKEQARTTAAAYNYVEKANDIAFQMSEVYIELLRQKEILEVEKEAVKITQEIFDKVKKLYNSGLTTLSEVNKIESSLSLAKSNLVVQEQNLKDASYSVQRVFGRFLDLQTIQRPEVVTTVPYDFDEAVRYAMKTNPSLLVSNFNIEMAKELHKEKQSFYYPFIDLSVSQSKNDNTASYIGRTDNFRAMITLSYNLFNGLADSATVQQSISNIQKEIQLKNDLRRQVVEGISLSLNAYEKQNERLLTPKRVWSVFCIYT